MAKRKAYKYKPKRNYDTILIISAFVVLLALMFILPSETERTSEETIQAETASPTNQIELMLYIEPMGEAQTTDK